MFISHFRSSWKHSIAYYILSQSHHQLMMVFRISSFSLPVRVRAKADVLGVWLLWPRVVGSAHHWVLVVTRLRIAPSLPIQAPRPREPRPMESLAYWSDSDRPHLILTWRQTQRGFVARKVCSIGPLSCLCDIRTWIALTDFSLLVFSQKVQTLKSLTFKWIPGAHNSQHKSHCQA